MINQEQALMLYHLKTQWISITDGLQVNKKDEVQTAQPQNIFSFNSSLCFVFLLPICDEYMERNIKKQLYVLALNSAQKWSIEHKFNTASFLSLLQCEFCLKPPIIFLHFSDPSLSRAAFPARDNMMFRHAINLTLMMR